MSRPFRASFLLSAVAALSMGGSAQAVQPPQSLPAQPVAAPITLGQSVVPLYGPWKFQIGDSPLNPVTHQPLWAEPGYDDSAWETVDLKPAPGMVDPFTGDPRYVPGWTMKGHAGYWGWAWYRIRVSITASPGDETAIATYGWVDDAYQLFDNGVLLGSSGKFRGPGKPPIAYFTQPEMFVLPSLPQPPFLARSGPGSVDPGSARHRSACIPRLDGTRTAFASPFHGRIPLRPGAGRERSNRGEESCGMAGADPAIRILRFLDWACFFCWPSWLRA